MKRVVELITFENDLLKLKIKTAFCILFDKSLPSCLDKFKKQMKSKMNNIFPFRQLVKTIFLFLLVTPFFLGCETHRFDSDNRQIMAKDEIRNQLHKPNGYDITGFKEDTIEAKNGSGLKKEIRYILDFQYNDSNKVLQKKTGTVFFTPDGLSIINSTITDR